MSFSLRDACPPFAGELGETATDRLVLRPIGEESVDLLAPVFAKPEVWRYPYGKGFTQADTEAFVAAQAEHWDTLGFGVWMVIERESLSAVGYVGLAVPTFFEEVLPAVEVGWRLDPDVWGRGYATEAAKAALSAGFETLQLCRIISLPQTENTPSVRVARRIGMKHQHDAIAPATDRRGPAEVAVMAITVEQWRLLRVHA